jgi:DNA gyrase subunit B
MSKYTSANIDSLDILEAIRLRPGMYLGGADDDAVLVATNEIIDNSVDEHMNGHGDEIAVTINPDTSTITVKDYARGIPIDDHPKHPGKSTLEVVLTHSHSGGKFGKDYGVSGGLHGIGLKAVTATSRNMIATVRREGFTYTLRFKDSVRVKSLEKKKRAPGENDSGTEITFQLDPAIFVDATSMIPSREVLRRALHERAYLNPGLKLSLRWGNEPIEVFYEKNGIEAYVASLAKDKTLFSKIAHFKSVDSPVEVDVAIVWTSGFGKDGVIGFCNCIRQKDGGTHLQGLKMALPGVIRNYVERNNMLNGKDRDIKIEAADCFEGVLATVSIRHRSPVFKGQSKSYLASGDAQGAVQKAVNSGMGTWLEENPKEAKILIARIVAAAKARIAAGKAREQSRKQENGTFSLRNFGKLKDCASRDIERNELLIVEGDSAGGSCSLGRDRRTQAVYPLKGKPLNTWEANTTKLLENAEISDLISVIGTGLMPEELPEEAVQAVMNKLRYGKIIILADADIDGCFVPETFIETSDGICTYRTLIEEAQIGKPKTGKGAFKDGDGNFHIQDVELKHPRITKQVTELIEITLANMATITCTPEQMLLLSNGEWKQAKDLTTVDDLAHCNDRKFL